jgi:hypothetical protein
MCGSLGVGFFVLGDGMRIARMVEDWLRHDDRGVLALGSVEQHAGLSLATDAILAERLQKTVFGFGALKVNDRIEVRGSPQNSRLWEVSAVVGPGPRSGASAGDCRRDRRARHHHPAGGPSGHEPAGVVPSHQQVAVGIVA